MKRFLFTNLKGYKLKWLRSDLMAALVVTAISIPQSLGFAVIVGVPVQAGLYCALLAPVVFAIFTSSKRLVVGADSATAALVAAGAATVAATGSAGYGNAVAVLGLVTAGVLLAMSVLRFGFMADLISRPVLIGFLSGVGVQLLIGQLPDMLGFHAKGDIFDKLVFLAGHFGHIQLPTAVLSAAVVAIVVVGWKLHWPGALIALLGAVVVTKLFGLHHYGIEVVGAVPPGLPGLRLPHFDLRMIATLLPAAASIAIVILAQSLAVTRSSAARHEEKVNDNQDLLALSLANATSALTSGFAICGSPPRTSAGEMAGGRSQLMNVIMAGLIGLVLVAATGLFEYMPSACLAAVVFTVGLHLIKLRELREVFTMRRSEFGVALVALGGVAAMGVQRGVMLAVIISLIERLRRQYHPHDEILLRDQQYTEWASDRFGPRKHPLAAPAGLLVYRFNEALFFENSGYFTQRIEAAMAKAKQPLRGLILDAGAISDIDFTAAQVLGQLINQLAADDIQFGIAHVSPRLRAILKRYGLTDLIGSKNIHPSLRLAIKAYAQKHETNLERIHALKLQTTDYVTIGGTVLELLGIRPTTDVDLVVNKDVYHRLRDSSKWKEYVQDDGKKILVRQGYRIMQRWMGRSLTDLQKHAFEAQGVPVMGLDDLIECKTQLGRHKDLADVKLIKTYQSQVEQKTGTFVPSSKKHPRKAFA